jgi:hypothetical protein
MPMSDSHSYYSRRAEEEAKAAEQAGDPRAAATHRDLAQHYRKLADGIEDSPIAEVRPIRAGILAREFRIVP